MASITLSTDQLTKLIQDAALNGFSWSAEGLNAECCMERDAKALPATALEYAVETVASLIQNEPH